MDDSPVQFDDEKKELDDSSHSRYLALTSPSGAAPSAAPLFSHTTATSSTFDLHSVEEKKEEPAYGKQDPTSSFSAAAPPAHHIAVAAKQKSSTIDAATLPALPCPGQQYMYTWRWASLLYFGWMTPLIRLGAKRPLEFTDLWQTFDSDKAEVIWSHFEPGWHAQVEKAKAQGRPPKLLNTFTRVYGWQFLWCCLTYGYVNADALLGPQFLQKLVEYSVDASEGVVSVWQGYKWCVMMFASAVLAAFCRSYALHYTTRIFLRARNALILAIYRKSLRIPSRNRDDGKINNLMSSDTQKLVEFSQQVHNLWSAPIIIAVGVYELYQQVGYAAILGLVVMICFLPVAGLMTAAQIKYQKNAALKTDRRVTTVNEFIQGVRVVKYYGWERPMLGVLDQAREEELAWLKKYVVLKSITFGTLMLVPLIVSIVVFGTYVGNGGDMTPTVVFTAIALINVIRMPFTFIPLALMNLTQTLVAFSRIEAFLALPEIEDHRQTLDHPGLQMEGVQLTWADEDERVDSTLEKKNGEKAAVVQKNPAARSGEDEEHAERDQQALEQTVAAEVVASAGSSGTQAPPDEVVQTLAEKDQTTVQADNVLPAPGKKAGDEKRKGPQPPRLTDVNISVGRGELVLVIGAVGSGKSTLLCGLLGEVEQTAGRTSIGGKLSYVPQTAFIINASLRQNVVFGQQFDGKRYAACLKACALDSDIALLPNGDLTEIGERGINISGGQKQRISIARAAYSMDSDIVLLDDPLSAVDAHVSAHIFEHCINGLMRGRTRILVTHSMAYVDEADQIFLVKPTAVKDSFTIKKGTAKQLRLDDDMFISLLATYNRGKDAVEGTDGTLVKAKKREATAAVATVTKAGDNALEKKEKGVLTESEEREVGDISWKVYRRYFTSGGSLMFYITAPLFFCACQAIQTSGDFWLAKWSNNLYGSSIPQGEWIGVYGVLIFGSTMAMIGRTTTMSLFGVHSSRVLHHDLARSILSKSISWFDRTPAGRIINRFTKDLYSIDLLLSMMMEFAIATSLSVIGIFIVIAIIIPISLAIFAPIVVLYLVITRIYRKSNTELQRLESISRTPIFTHFGETLGGSITIRALKVQPAYVEENVRRVDLNARAFYYSRAVNFWLRFRLDLLGSIVLGASAVLAVGSHKLGSSAISSGDFGLLISYALNVTNLLNISVILLSLVEAMMNSVERVMYYSVPRDEEKWEADDPKLSQSVQGGHWPSKGHIVVRDLQLRYRANLDLVLKGINLEFKPGQRVAVVGRTGSGKSSFLVSLFRMVEPCGGQILIDGVDIQKISLSDVRTNLSILPQDATLFHGTLKYNIDPWAAHSDDEVWQALRYVQLEGVVRRMPKQLETMVAEAGANLSAGQRQLLCLARALMRKPKVLALDEATANVDIETDELIQRVIREQFSQCTIITIAHRLNTILDYDLVVVLDKGVVVELDSPEVLRRKEGGIFAGMLQGTGSKENEEAA